MRNEEYWESCTLSKPHTMQRPKQNANINNSAKNWPILMPIIPILSRICSVYSNANLENQFLSSCWVYDLLEFESFINASICSFSNFLLYRLLATIPLRFPIFWHQFHKNWSIFGGVIDVCILLGALHGVGLCPVKPSTAGEAKERSPTVNPRKWSSFPSTICKQPEQNISWTKIL